METFARLAGVIAGILPVVALVPYVISVLRGRTKPNRATWWIWTLVGILTIASYRSSGADQTIWLAVAYAFCPFVIGILSIRYGQGGWDRTDQGCLLLTGISLVVWWILESALAALLLHIFIDFLGLIPTLKKVYFRPHTESRLAWTLAWSGCTINLFAIERWTFAIAFHPIYHFLSSLAMVVLLWRKKYKVPEEDLR